MDTIAKAIEEATGASASELAPAKINLALHVGAQRPDGYHFLESLVVFADLADVVTVRTAAKSRSTTLDITGPFAELLGETTKPEDNLALKAANALGALAPKRQAKPMQLTINKRIPLAAGLGGGSADAAAVLRLLQRSWGFEADPKKLAAIAIGLGADVPMCLELRPLIARGVGEQITPVAGMPALPLVLAHPGVIISTGAVFAGLGLEQRSPLPAMPAKFPTLLDLIYWLRKARNDLVDPAKVVSRKATAAATALSKDPDCLFARMSGSGATAFGIFVTLAAAERAAARLQKEKPDWWVTTAMTQGS